MRSFDQWKIQESKDPDWDELRRVWGAGKKPVNRTLMNSFKMRVEKFKEAMVAKAAKENDRIQSFRDIPLDQKDMMAQSLVVAVLQAFYDTGGSTFDPTKRDTPMGNMPGNQPNTPPPGMPQQSGLEGSPAEAPEGWTGQ
jgi:hypothetical protein